MQLSVTNLFRLARDRGWRMRPVSDYVTGEVGKSRGHAGYLFFRHKRYGAGTGNIRITLVIHRCLRIRS